MFPPQGSERIQRKAFKFVEFERRGLESVFSSCPQRNSLLGPNFSQKSGLFFLRKKNEKSLLFSLLADFFLLKKRVRKLVKKFLGVRIRTKSLGFK